MPRGANKGLAASRRKRKAAAEAAGWDSSEDEGDHHQRLGSSLMHPPDDGPQSERRKGGADEEDEPYYVRDQRLKRQARERDVFHLERSAVGGFASTSSRRQEDPGSSRFGGSEEKRRDSMDLCITAHEMDVRFDGATKLRLERREGEGAGRMRWVEAAVGGGEAEQEVWTDRFDILHLLQRRPSGWGAVHRFPSSIQTTEGGEEEQGWSDLGSDAEDLFFLASRKERDGVEFERRKRRLEEERRKRVDAREEEEREREREEGEERARREAERLEAEKLTKAQLELMRRTSQALSKTSTPAVLEMRILANHGSDPRFAFLRKGKEQRWGQVWARLRRGENVEWEEFEEGEKEKKEKGAGRGEGKGLLGMDYDSDSDGGSSSGDKGDEPSPPEPEDEHPAPPPPPEAEASTAETLPSAAPVPSPANEDAINVTSQEERLARAREWAAKRREEKEKLAAADHTSGPQ